MMNKVIHKELNIRLGDISLNGDLFMPASTNAIIIFSHGSGSSRFSKRNRQVAVYLNERGFGTLLLDLLTPAEDRYYENRFNIQMLTNRLTGATEWLAKLPAAQHCTIGYFGASTGAASAIQAAADLVQVRAVVSRGGRPDLASMDALKKVRAPVLLIVGGLDTEVLHLNEQTFRELQCAKQLVVVDGATHLFEEPGKLDEVAKLAAAWFEKHLMPATDMKMNIKIN